MKTQMKSIAIALCLGCALASSSMAVCPMAARSSSKSHLRQQPARLQAAPERSHSNRLMTGGRRVTRDAPRTQRGALSAVASVALRDAGVREGSRRANEMARAAGLRSSVGRRNAWCAAAVSDWLSRAGTSVRTASVSTLRTLLRSEGWHRTSHPVPGAVAFYRSRSHVGVVVEDQGRTVRTAEGNSNNMVRFPVVPVGALEYWIRG